MARRVQGNRPGTNQGYGWEYMDKNGNWHHVSSLKPNSSSYNPVAANETHIPIPSGLFGG